MGSNSELVKLIVDGLSLAPFVVIITSLWIIYEKAGFKGWECIVPIYGYLVFLKIIGRPWYWILFLFFPVLSTFIIVWGFKHLSKRFGKNVAFTIGILFLPYVFLPILAFGNAKYRPEEQS